MIVAKPKIEPMDVTVGDLYLAREKFSNYPNSQRGKVWPPRRNKMFVNYILQFGDVPTQCQAVKRADGTYGVYDGKQRQLCIFSFIENGFTTLTEAEATNYFLRQPPAEPGCTFKDLRPATRALFEEFVFRYTLCEDTQSLEERFININEGEVLTNAERLHIHDSLARRVATDLLAHPFWDDVYQGRTQRNESFQAALMMLIVEIMGFPVNLKVYNVASTPLNRLVMGGLDNLLTDTLKNTIWRNLTIARHLFHGVFVFTRCDAIPLYQATSFLALQTGRDLLESQKGCMLDWYHAARRGTILEHLNRRLPFRALEQMHFQRDFWEVHTAEVLRVEGLLLH